MVNLAENGHFPRLYEYISSEMSLLAMVPDAMVPGCQWPWCQMPGCQDARCAQITLILGLNTRTRPEYPYFPVSG